MLECRPGAESNAKILPRTITLATGLKPSFPQMLGLLLVNTLQLSLFVKIVLSSSCFTHGHVTFQKQHISDD